MKSRRIPTRFRRDSDATPRASARVRLQPDPTRSSSGSRSRREEEGLPKDVGLDDFDRKFGLDRFDPGFVRDLGEQMREQARHVADGPKRLAAYLAAPAEVRAEFDRLQAEAYYAETEAQRLAGLDGYSAEAFERWLTREDDRG